jgi:hypothetical protein
MGRPSKRPGGAAQAVQITCYYCTRAFDSESTLLQHQKSIHFKCPKCNRRFSSAPAMGVHMQTLHQEPLRSVPKAEPGRDDPTLNIVGTLGAPLFDDEQIKRMREAAQSGQGYVPPGQPPPLPAPPPAAFATPLPAAAVNEGFAYPDDKVSPEEKRALLDRYKFDPNAVKQKLSALDASISERLKAALAKSAA